MTFISSVLLRFLPEPRERGYNAGAGDTGDAAPGQGPGRGPLCLLPHEHRLSAGPP